LAIAISAVDSNCLCTKEDKVIELPQSITLLEVQVSLSEIYEKVEFEVKEQVK
jgi:hypothetical protein